MGIGFQVIHSPHKPQWVPIDGTATMALGMLVYYGKKTPAGTGVIVKPVSSGMSDVTNFQVPWGVIVGDNNATPTYTTLTTANVKVQTIDGVNSVAAQIARDYRSAEGMYGKGDPQPLVQVVRITPETVLRGYFRNSATVGTTNILTKTTDGTTYTSAAITFAATMGFTPVAYNATTYCVTGTNAGLYRRRSDTDVAVSTYAKYWPYTPGATDTFKSVNVAQGICRMDFDTTYGLWIDNTAALTSNCYVVNVLNINLDQESGNEYCDFQFALDMFLTTNSARLTT